MLLMTASDFSEPVRLRLRMQSLCGFACGCRACAALLADAEPVRLRSQTQSLCRFARGCRACAALLVDVEPVRLCPWI